jgi:UPF0755 protein
MPRRPRGGGFLAKLSAFLTLAVVLFAVAAGVILYGQKQLNAPGPLAQDKIVFIPRGSSTSDIASLLEQEGIISNAFHFEIAHMLSTGGNLKAGEYQFKQNASVKEVRETILEGRSILHSITIPEGLTSEQIVQRLRENEILVGDVNQIPAEGALLPDTYRFGRGFSRSQLLAQMENSQKRWLAEIWQRRSPDVPLKSPRDLVILASIVEKETGRSDERPRVASVFVNRINRGMRLESDPTIIYGLVGGKGTLGRGILASEIRQATPYNTYVINGLPPGPIANPGRAAMEATANPAKTRDIFFVADGTGGHAFAETLEQHNRNVRRWRQIEGGEAAPAAPPPANAAPAPALRPRTSLPESGSRNAQAPVNSFAPDRAALSAAGIVTDEAAKPDLEGVETYPVPAGRRQAIQRNAQQAGQGQPLHAQALASQDIASEAAAPRRPRAFDASEGTAKDPLRNKTFDLNSPKTVPTLR